MKQLKNQSIKTKLVKIVTKVDFKSGIDVNVESGFIRIKEKVNFPELEYDVDNGICLCNDCHRKTDNYGYKAKIKKAVLLHDD